MSTLVARAETLAVDVECSGDALRVTLSDGRIVSVPLVWFPRLLGFTNVTQFPAVGFEEWATTV